VVSAGQVSSKLGSGRGARPHVSVTWGLAPDRRSMRCRCAEFQVSYASGAAPAPLGVKLPEGGGRARAGEGRRRGGPQDLGNRPRHAEEWGPARRSHGGGAGKAEPVGEDRHVVPWASNATSYSVPGTSFIQASLRARRPPLGPVTWGRAPERRSMRCPCTEFQVRCIKSFTTQAL
jgi:hypothetical protein